MQEYGDIVKQCMDLMHVDNNLNLQNKFVCVFSTEKMNPIEEVADMLCSGVRNWFRLSDGQVPSKHETIMVFYPQFYWTHCCTTFKQMMDVEAGVINTMKHVLKHFGEHRFNDHHDLGMLMNIRQDIRTTTHFKGLCEFKHVGIVIMEPSSKLIIHPQVIRNFYRHCIQCHNYFDTKCSTITPSAKKMKIADAAHINMPPTKLSYASAIESTSPYENNIILNDNNATDAIDDE